MVTNRSSCEHHKAAKVRQLLAPSTFSSCGNEANSQRRSQNKIREVVTPALLALSLTVHLFLLPMKLRILTVGKLANKHCKALCEDYLARISHHAPIQLEFVRQEKIAAQPAAEIIAKESKRILERLRSADWNILLDKSGVMLSSEELANYLQQLANRQKYLTFIIGGPLGTAVDLGKKADFTLSLSKMTFSHELATVLLLEQLYRAFSIMRGEKYHK